MSCCVYSYINYVCLTKVDESNVTCGCSNALGLIGLYFVKYEAKLRGMIGALYMVLDSS